MKSSTDTNPLTTSVAMSVARRLEAADLSLP